MHKRSDWIYAYAHKTLIRSMHKCIKPARTWPCPGWPDRAWDRAAGPDLGPGAQARARPASKPWPALCTHAWIHSGLLHICANPIRFYGYAYKFTRMLCINTFPQFDQLCVFVFLSDRFYTYTHKFTRNHSNPTQTQNINQYKSM
jgi:hypothetical protein